ncbi:unnamed protein product [Rotaria sordida]|uniref:F-box domain-containing protein n=1 Tax=Rotaria sordida TaxID=392033 RepID=A0A819T2Y7_9BILA|nr:unnamed protein product [Rotaria sordida]
MIPMPGLNVAQFAYGGVSPRRIQQQSPTVAGAQFFLSTGYATPNRDTELIVCAAEDPSCEKPRVMNTVDSSGFGQAGLRLTFTQPFGLPIMLIPEAKYASRDNRVTGYKIEACQDPLCQLPRSLASLPFNLTGTANCLGTSIDVAINRFGFPSWLTLCDEELNLIHCLSPTCNQTLVNQFKVNRDFVYFVYLAVDSHFRFTITTTGQTAQSDITYIRCLNPDCTESIQSQLTIANRSSTRSPVGQVQVVINPLTDLPVFHVTGSTFPADIPVLTATKFEDLPNELILMCFNYIDFYQLYETFFCLNPRFNKLILYDAKIHVDFGAIPSGKFLTFCFNLNQLTNTNKNYPLSIRADDEYQFYIFFEDDLFKDKFSKLKSLIINNIKIATLSNIIFDEKIKLNETLERLSLMEDISGEDYEIQELCNNLISSKMKSLKYLNLNFEIYECECEHDVYEPKDYVDLNFEELSIRENSLNNLKTIIIGYIPKNDRDFATTRISFYSLAEKLLPCLPKLKNLIINSVYLDLYDYQYYKRKVRRKYSHTFLIKMLH